ncbi:MAG: hypothetical protein BKP49_09790 [Treponema sp. CETP13]|nr:MAG: hypothetical protein BKP49_09790 [Treponema sp. CETP13]
MNKIKGFILFVIFVTSSSYSLFAISVTPWINVEAGGFITQYNNVKIPSETGTLFSLCDDLSTQDWSYYRLNAGIDLNRHSISVLYAPLLVKSTGTIDKDITFYGETFTEGSSVTGLYKFNSYRLTYAYKIIDKPKFNLAAGISAKIRDAYISLDDGTTSAKRSDFAVLPLIHLSTEWLFATHFSLLLKGDGLVAPQGRAEDFQLALVYTPIDNMSIRAGYRILEGGSDGGGSVYSFSMFHYFGLGIEYRF